MSAPSGPDIHFRDLPAGAEPARVGRRLAQVFMADNPADPKHYKVACGGATYAGDEENYYFERPKLTGDNHGQAPVLWSAAALLRPRGR